MFIQRKGFALTGAMVLILILVATGGAYVIVKNQQKRDKEKVLAEQVEKIRKEGLVIGLSAQNNSDQSGTATLIVQTNAQTKVVIQVDDWKPGVAQPAHIHVGSCPNPGSVKYSLNSVVNGRSESMVNVRLDVLLQGLPLAVNVHKSAAESNVYVSCGNISGDVSVLELLILRLKAVFDNGEDEDGDEDMDEDKDEVDLEAQGKACLSQCYATYVNNLAGLNACTQLCVDAGAKVEVEEFTVTRTNLTLLPATIKVEQGDKVKITFKNQEGTHNFRIDAYDVTISQLKAGESVTVEFTAHIKGTFEFVSVDSTNTVRLKGVLIVE